jgi:hypothetical protein
MSFICVTLVFSCKRQNFLGLLDAAPGSANLAIMFRVAEPQGNQSLHCSRKSELLQDGHLFTWLPGLWYGMDYLLPGRLSLNSQNSRERVSHRNDVLSASESGAIGMQMQSDF